MHLNITRPIVVTFHCNHHVTTLEESTTSRTAQQQRSFSNGKPSQESEGTNLKDSHQERNDVMMVTITRSSPFHSSDEKKK